MTSKSTMYLYAAMADAQAPRESYYFGLNDPSVAGLRAFIRYHKDARQDYVINGRMRSLTHKQVAMAGLFSRISVTHEHATIRSLAKEAHVAPSTVSRFMLKLQAWGQYAIDVTRGRNGGITVRLRTLRDGLSEYASRAWERIKMAAIRAQLNVASTFLGGKRVSKDDDVLVPVLMDATFRSADAIERLGAAVLAGEISVEEASGPDRRPTEADLEWARAERFAREVLIERKRLDDEEPDWDAYLDNVRASYGMKPA